MSSLQHNLALRIFASAPEITPITTATALASSHINFVPEEIQRGLAFGLTDLMPAARQSCIWPADTPPCLARGRGSHFLSNVLDPIPATTTKFQAARNFNIREYVPTPYLTVF